MSDDVEIKVSLKGNAAKKYIASQKAVRAENKKVVKSMKSVNKSAMSMTSAYGAVAGVLSGVVVSSFIKTQQNLDRINNTLKVSKGSAAAAAEEFEFIKVTSKRLGLEITALGLGYAQFTAAAKNSNITTEQQRKIFIGVAEASAAMGLSSDQAKGAMVALQQMISKGTVSSEELRQQLSERIPGAMGMAAKAMKMTSAEFSKQLGLGRIMADDLLPKLADEMHKTYGPQAAAGAKQLNGSIQSLKNTIFELQAEILENGGRELLIKGFQGASKAVKIFGENIDAIIATGKTFFVVWSAAKIAKIVSSVSTMALTLNPVMLGLAAAVVAVQVGLKALDDEAKSLEGKKGAFNNLVDLKKLRAAVETMHNLRTGIARMGSEIAKNDGISETANSKRKLDQDARLIAISKLLLVTKQVTDIAGKGYAQDQKGIPDILKGLDGEIARLEKVEKIKDKAETKTKKPKTKAEKFKSRGAPFPVDYRPAVAAAIAHESTMLGFAEDSRQKELELMQLKFDQIAVMTQSRSEEEKNNQEVLRSELSAINDKWNSIDEQKRRESFERKIQMANVGFQMGSSLAGAFSNLASVQADNEVKSAKRAADSKIKLAKASGSSRKEIAKIEIENQKNVEAAQKKAFETNKRFSKAGAAISMAQAIVNALAMVPFPLGLVSAGVAATAGAVQLAAIDNQQFRDGGIATGPTSGYQVTMHGSEAVIPLKNGAVPVRLEGDFGGGSGGGTVINNYYGTSAPGQSYTEQERLQELSESTQEMSALGLTA